METPPPPDYQKLSDKGATQEQDQLPQFQSAPKRFVDIHILVSLSHTETECIMTLEDDVAKCDRLLDVIHRGLSTLPFDNVAFRQEIAALKRALLDGRGAVDNPVLSPASGSTQNPAIVSTPAPATHSLISPNTQKDLWTPPRLGSWLLGSAAIDLWPQLYVPPNAQIRVVPCISAA
jgi:hypothetical protein